MKKGIKITLISVSSLLGLVLLTFLVACWLIFTPARLTAIVNKLSDKYLTCQSSFQKVDLTLFRTFPDAGIDIHNVVLVNPMEGTDDTLARLNSLVLAVNVRDFVKNRDIIVKQVLLDGVKANIYTNADGKSNYDIFPASETVDTSTSESSPLPDNIDIQKVKVSDFNCRYQNDADRMTALVDGLDLSVNGTLKQSVADGKMKLSTQSVQFLSRDSLMQPSISALLSDLTLSLKASGSTDDLEGALQLSLPKADISLDGTTYATDSTARRKKLLSLDIPFRANLDSMLFHLDDAALHLAQFKLDLDGSVLLPSEADSLLGTPSRDMLVDLAFSTGRWNVADLLTILPAGLTSWSEGMNLDADLQLSGSARGVVNDSLLPKVDAKLRLSDGRFYDKTILPYDFRKINADLDAELDISSYSPQPSKVTINQFDAVTGRNQISLTGTINDLLGRFLADVRLRGDIRLPDVKPMLPDDLDLDAKGKAKLDLHAKADLDQISRVDLKNMLVDGTIAFKNVDLRLDSIWAQTSDLKIALNIDPRSKKRVDHQLLNAKITGGELHANVMPSNIVADLGKVDMVAYLSDVLDTTVPFDLACDFDFGEINALVDSMQAVVGSPQGVFRMQENDADPAKVRYEINYSNSSLSLVVNDTLSLAMAGLSIKGDANYDSTRSNVLQQWSPNLDVDLKQAFVSSSELMYTLQIPNFKFNYKPELCEIASANVAFGNSDFYLSGAVTGLEKWLSHEDMLRGDLFFTSNFTNVDDLLATFSGMGSDPDTLQQQRVEDNVPKEANPFIVPKDVNVTLHTRIKECVAYENEFQELAGDICVNNGEAILNQVGFTCKATRMQLTGVYRTPRVNHIFCGLDFHLLDIQIDSLVDMIPYVDSLVPMLASFSGNADFHLCAETYLNAFYEPKYSTLRAAADVNGHDLVVMDNAKISNIAKLLRLKDWKTKDDKIMVDSLDVCLTCFRKEVEVYPFLLNSGKYQLCVAGHHDLDMNGAYHLEVVRTPLPGRLAVDVLNLDPFDLKLGKVQYVEGYRPLKNASLTEAQQRIRAMVRQSLEANVKQETRAYQGLN